MCYNCDGWLLHPLQTLQSDSEDGRRPSLFPPSYGILHIHCEEIALGHYGTGVSSVPLLRTSLVDAPRDRSAHTGGRDYSFGKKQARTKRALRAQWLED